MAKLAERRKQGKARYSGSASARAASRPATDGFWDRPPLLNLVADLLLLFGTLALTYAALVTAVRLPVFPLQQVVVVSELEQVTPTQIDYAAKSSLAGNFFTVNLDNVRAAVEKLPWVRKASVRRRWPDGIELVIEEHVVVARWHGSSGEARLVNNHGEVFAAALPAGQSSLPLFGGPEGSAPLMLERFHEFNAVLAPLGRALRVVALSPRQAWQLRLDDGLTLELGRDQTNYPIHDRLQRFVGIYGEAKERSKSTIATIDMRYPNGFALRPGHAEATHASNLDAPRNSSKGIT